MRGRPQARGVEERRQAGQEEGKTQGDERELWQGQAPWERGKTQAEPQHSATLCFLSKIEMMVIIISALCASSNYCENKMKYFFIAVP